MAAFSERRRREAQAIAVIESTSQAEISPWSTVTSTSFTPTQSADDHVEKMPAELSEDLTVRFSGCFIRCVINYGQPVSRKAAIYFQDARLLSAFLTSQREYTSC
ncbi:hypothetical protein HIM_05079 [Hirsutella minnesotensis 3608]|uniref:Uncharacterized protein n=1 Tax=Hirsutella minnesotensis 3608 TaxID=1043627 RepID=A0A0F7ZKT3_9HYPO|nr:hypothetical protein HIM_05079 [Hirsutella minnesotensis 3608]